MVDFNRLRLFSLPFVVKRTEGVKISNYRQLEGFSRPGGGWLADYTAVNLWENFR